MSINSISDQDLIKSYLEGKEVSLNILISKYRRRVLGFILSKVQDVNVAEDIFQDTFIKVINTLKLGKYNEQGKFLPWVLRISYNLSMDFFRNKKKRIFVRSNDDFNIFDIINDQSLTIEDKMIHNKTMNEIKLLIEELPENQKQVLKMRYYCDMSFNEIAESCGISINTALGRMRYAILNLRKIIRNKGVSLSIN